LKLWPFAAITPVATKPQAPCHAGAHSAHDDAVCKSMGASPGTNAYHVLPFDRFNIFLT
jgi:hypothetical protein